VRGSRSLLCVAGLLMVLLTPVRVLADAKAVDILRRAEEVRNPDFDYAVDFHLLVLNPETVWKERHARYSLLAQGKDDTLVLMREPTQFYPGTLLINQGLYWLLLPRSQKALQLSPRSILNGDISNGDLTRSNLLNDYVPTLAGEEKLDGRGHWKLELTRKRNRAMYPRIICWIDKKNHRMKRFDFYGETDLLMKIARYEDYRKTAIGWRSMRIEVENKARPGQTSTLEFSNLRELDSSGVAFTKEAMLAFRDAALAQMDAGLPQISIEELVRVLQATGP
jgi:hypothetical protein